MDQQLAVSEPTHAQDADFVLLDADPAPEASRDRDLEQECADLRAHAFHLERLAQAGILAGGLIHDMRNLLAGICGTCQLAQVDPVTRPSQVYERVNQLALQAADAMRVFLTFVRKGDGGTSSCRVEDVLSDAVRFLTPVLKGSRVTLDRRVAPGLVVVGERTLLLQVLVNLLQNAVRAIGSERGTVEIVAAHSAAGVLVDVRDDGPGIPEGVRSRLFEAFATGSASTGGSGLGLHTARRIVEQLGGSLSLLATGPGGTTFRLALRAGDDSGVATESSRTGGLR